MKYGPDYYASRRMSAPAERHVARTVAKILRVADVSPDARILEIGCGFGALTRVLAARCREIVGLDVSEHAIARAREGDVPCNVSFVKGDALSFAAPGKFDLVLALAVFEHFTAKEQKRFLDRARRWLAPGGRLALHVPIAESWSAKRRTTRRDTDGPDYTGDPTHRATFSPATLRAAVARGGFRVEREWVRHSRWGWPEGWARGVQRAMPARLRDKFAMEMLVAAVPE
jgi:SAM-dependent methyltransferase